MVTLMKDKNWESSCRVNKFRSSVTLRKGLRILFCRYIGEKSFKQNFCKIYINPTQNLAAQCSVFRIISAEGLKACFILKKSKLAMNYCFLLFIALCCIWVIDLFVVAFCSCKFKIFVITSIIPLVFFCETYLRKDFIDYLN